MKGTFPAAISAAVALFLWGRPAYADVVWPSLYIVAGMESFAVIAAGLAVEIPFVKFFVKVSWARALLLAIVMNLTTAVTGIVFIPVSGIVVEILLIPTGTATFHLIHWVISYAAVAAVNALAEGATLRLIQKQRIRSTFSWLLAANAFSVLFCVLLNGFAPDRSM